MAKMDNTEEGAWFRQLLHLFNISLRFASMLIADKDFQCTSGLGLRISTSLRYIYDDRREMCLVLDTKFY